MLRVILKHLNFLISKNRNHEDRFEARKKFEENLRALKFVDKVEVDENDNKQLQEPVVELAWSCAKYEGNFLSF
jgi:hypothetical protein